VFGFLETIREYRDAIGQLLYDVIVVFNELYYGLLCPLYEGIVGGTCPDLGIVLSVSIAGLVLVSVRVDEEA